MGRKAGACGTALGDVIEQLGVGAVRNDHVSSAGGHHPGGPELGGHSAGTQRRAGPVGQRHHLGRDVLHQRDELCVRVGVGVGSVEAVDVAQQHQQIGLDAAGDDGGEGVIVADGGDLVGGDGVVLVDDGQCAQLQQAGEGVLDVLAAAGVLDVHAGEQNLRHRVVVGAEQPVVGVHQLTLAHSGAGLLGGGVLWAGWQ